MEQSMRDVNVDLNTTVVKADVEKTEHGLWLNIRQLFIHTVHIVGLERNDIMRNQRNWMNFAGEIVNTKGTIIHMVEDIYFKMHCLYNAETELYDRTLTDRRDRYDPTSAYINCSNEVRNKSNFYAFTLYQWCIREIERKTGRPFDRVQWIDSIRGYERLSAQGWIDLYKNLDKDSYYD